MPLCINLSEKKKVQQIWITFNLNFCNDTRSTGEIQYHANTRCQSLRKICSSTTLGHSLFMLYAHACAFETLCIRPQERIKDESRGQVSRDAAEESSSRTSLFRNRTQSERTVYVYYRGAGCAMLLTARIRASGNAFSNNVLGCQRGKNLSLDEIRRFYERGKLKRNSWKDLKTRCVWI